MNKYKCNGCGKIHETKPEACTCGSDKGFTEVIIEVKKEEVDLEALKAQWAKEQEADIQAKLDDEKAKLKKDSEDAEAERVKALRAQILKEQEDDAKLSEDQKRIKEMEKKLNSVLELNDQYKQTVDTLSSEREENSKKIKRMALKDELTDVSKDKPWMTELVKVEFEGNRINSIEDYNALCESFYGKQAKEAYELKEQSKKWGEDPANTYKKLKTANKEAKLEISEEAKARADKRLARAGVK